MSTTSKTTSPTTVHEIADGVYRISTPVDAIPGGFTFNQFLIDDDEPLLFHTGLRKLFPWVRDAISSVLPVERLRYIAFSHVEADECGALNEFLAAAPHAEAVCSRTAAMVSVNDLADRPPHAMGDGETLSLGRHVVEWRDTPHVPHGWESGNLFDQRTRTLFCGDLFTQPGSNPKPLSEDDILGPSEAMRASMNYFAQTKSSGEVIRRIAQSKPTTLACMHGSAWTGDGEKLLRALADAVDPR